jgi:hypothetical protein
VCHCGNSVALDRVSIAILMPAVEHAGDQVTFGGDISESRGVRCQERGAWPATMLA